MKKVKFTHPLKPYQAGLVYEMSDEEAEKYIQDNIAIEVAVEMDTTPPAGNEPIEEKKKVKHGNRPNYDI